MQIYNIPQIVSLWGTPRPEMYLFPGHSLLSNVEMSAELDSSV